MNVRRTSAFTLVEVLIVVVIVAILAATIIPRLTDSSTDAKEALLRDHLRTLRSQIAVYKMHHKGIPPWGTNDMEQLTKATDADGNVSDTGLVDSTHPYGPYLKEMPVQPFSGSSTVSITTVPPTFTPAPGGGWIYWIGKGKLYVDHQDYSSW